MSFILSYFRVLVVIRDYKVHNFSEDFLYYGFLPMIILFLVIILWGYTISLLFSYYFGGFYYFRGLEDK